MNLSSAGVTASDQDRKSTRLNSSHLVISYAVFCLKKKKLAQCIASDAARPIQSQPHALLVADFRDYRSTIGSPCRRCPYHRNNRQRLKRQFASLVRLSRGIDRHATKNAQSPSSLSAAPAGAPQAAHVVTTSAAAFAGASVAPPARAAIASTIAEADASSSASAVSATRFGSPSTRT